MLLMKDIIDDHHPLIREISQPVEMPICQEDEQLLLDMHEFLVNSQDEEMSEKYHLRPAVGIAAVQVGVLKRMCGAARSPAWTPRKRPLRKRPWRLWRTAP